jgi:vaccinia related kinase
MKRAGAGTHKKLFARAETIPPGEILVDAFKKEWKIGKSIGRGGFGDIYLASHEVNRPVNEKTADYVVKIEPSGNGPLFVENSFYIRYAKVEMIQQWKTQRKIDSLGMPCFVCSGQHTYNSQTYRFMVIPRYGQDLHKNIQSKPLKRLSCRSVQAVALQVLDVLEYIHSKGCIHADVKASNLLMGLGKKEQLYLVDYGLAMRYMDNDGKHSDSAPDKRNAHNGTLEYASRDAHNGCMSRRSDLETLGYNMLEWLCGKLPWSNTDPPIVVQKQKVAFMSNIQLKKIYMPDIPGLELVEKYLKYVAALNFEQEPNYNYLRKMLKQDLPSKLNSLYLNDTVNVLSPKKKKRGSLKMSTQADGAVEDVEVVRKKIKIPDDEKKIRATRTTEEVEKGFNWTNVLSSNPEAIIRSASLNSSASNSPPEKNRAPKSPITGNLTPAMLQILAKTQENVCNSPFKGHNPPAQFTTAAEGTNKLTPAMQEILLQSKKKFHKLRKSLSMNTLPNGPLYEQPRTPPTHKSKLNGFHKVTPLSPAKPPVSAPQFIPPAPVAAAGPSSSKGPPFIPNLHSTGNGFANGNIQPAMPTNARQARYTRRNK